MKTHRISHSTRDDAVPIMILHGYTVDHRVLLPPEPVFDNHPVYQPLYPADPAHGNSPRPPGHTSAQTRADAVIEGIGEEPVSAFADGLVEV